MSYINTVDDVMDKVPAILSQKALQRISKNFGVKFIPKGTPESPRYDIVRNTQAKQGEGQ